MRNAILFLVVAVTPGLAYASGGFQIDEQSATVRKFLIVPIGFVCDHTEILFDIDVQAATAARDAGASLRRTESLNTSPTFIDALEAIVRDLL